MKFILDVDMTKEQHEIGVQFTNDDLLKLFVLIQKWAIAKQSENLNDGLLDK